MMGVWVFTVQLFKLLCVFEIFHNKMMGKNWCSPGLSPLTVLPLPTLLYVPGQGLGCRPISLIVP